MRNSSFKGLFLTALTAVACIVSCKKDYDPDFELSRQFKPGDINISQGETQVKLEWAPSLFTNGKNVEYTVEVSTDGTFQGTPDYTSVVDTSLIIITDADLVIKQPYYARVKANQLNATGESGWVVSETFMITGEQIFFPIQDLELKDTSVVLRWRTTPDLTRITITPDGGTAYDVPLTPADIAAEQIKIDGLTPLTAYKAEIFKETVAKGEISFTTKEPNIYTVILNPGDNLVTAVADAVSGDIIGLNPGTYDCVNSSGEFTNLTISGKTISIQSVSGEPSDTKVNYKEVTIKGTGAGLTIKGIDFDGAASATSGEPPLYFLNLAGLGSDGEAAVFTDITVDNCWVHNMANTFMRGNRGTNSADHKINTIKVSNSLIYNSALTANNYSFFQINKLQFTTLQITNSTMYSIGRTFIDWDGNFTANPRPEIIVDQCTINNFGMAGTANILFDINTNEAVITMQNSIFANTPYPGQTATSLVRASNAVISIKNSNYFNLMDGAATPAPLTIPEYVSQANNTTIDLGWTATTTDFTLAPGSPLRTTSTTGGPIGDPRWAF